MLIRLSNGQEVKSVIEFVIVGLKIHNNAENLRDFLFPQETKRMKIKSPRIKR